MSRYTLLALFLLPLTGCPEPQGEVTGQPGDPAAGTAPPPVDGSVPPPASGEGAPMGGPPPGFASLVTDGKTVTISGTVKGATKAQIDFTTITERDGQKFPSVIEVVQTTDGTFKVSAPASYAGEIWVTATVDAAGDGPTPDDKGGIAASAVQLNGKDVTVDVTISDDADWFKKLPWYVEPSAGMTPGAPPSAAPADGAAPAGGAPSAGGGAPPAGAAPAGGAPPAGAAPTGGAPPAP